MKRGFTLVEMLVVIGIIIVLLGASVAGYSRMTKSAERAKSQEMVANVATALTALFQAEGVWPKRLVDGHGRGLLTESVAVPLARGNYLSLTLNEKGNALAGLDRFGVVTPWAAAVIRRSGKEASLSTKVGNTGSTVQDHILHYALDLDGDGIIENVSVGGEQLNIRATAVVWSIGKSGGDNGQPWPYSKGRRKDDVYSWSYGQTQGVK